MNLGILFAFISMIAYGIGNAVSKTPSQRIGSKATIFWRNIVITMILFIAVLFSRPVFPLKFIIIAIIIGILGYFPLYFFTRAIKVGKVGIIQPVARASIVFRIMFAMIILKETLNLSQAIYIGIILFGAILISVEFKDFKSFTLEKGVIFALIASFLWGFVWVVFKVPVIALGAILASFILELMVMLTSNLHLKISKTKIRKPDTNTLLWILVVAFGGALGTLFFAKAIEIADVSIVSAFSAGNSLAATLIGYFIYKG